MATTLESIELVITRRDAGGGRVTISAHVGCDPSGDPYFSQWGAVREVLWDNVSTLEAIEAALVDDFATV